MTTIEPGKIYALRQPGKQPTPILPVTLTNGTGWVLAFYGSPQDLELLVCQRSLDGVDVVEPYAVNWRNNREVLAACDLFLRAIANQLAPVLSGAELDLIDGLMGETAPVLLTAMQQLIVMRKLLVVPVLSV